MAFMGKRLTLAGIAVVLLILILSLAAIPVAAEPEGQSINNRPVHTTLQ